MRLKVPIPPCLSGSNESQWVKFFAFWSLTFAQKAELIDHYPSLVTVRQSPPDSPVKNRVFFDDAVFETQVKPDDVFKYWDRVEVVPGIFKPQPLGIDAVKAVLFAELNPLNFTALAYKYRHTIRPKDYLFDCQYNEALLNIATEDELRTFYEFTTN